MHSKELEADDPYALVGQGFPCPEDLDPAGGMARCFVEEFALLGCPAGVVMDLFRSPFYQGPHAVYRARGEDFVRDLIRDVYGTADLVEAPNA